MVIAVLSLILLRAPLAETLDPLAVKRDVAGISRYVAEGAWKGRNPLTVIRTNGAYETGKFGWHALQGQIPGGKQYIVLTTPLTSEDVGERLFETDGEKLTKYIDEREDYGWRIENHSLTVSFNIPEKKVTISDRLKVRHEGADGPLIFRLGPNYRIKGISAIDGVAPGWTQLGGIVFIHKPTNGQTMVLTYEGVVDKPNYAGSINDDEAMLTNDYWYPMIARKPTSYGMTVFGPADWTVVGQGELVGTKALGAGPQDGQRVTSFRMDLPCTYWSLNLSKYKTVTSHTGGRKFTVWSKTLSDQQMLLQTELYPLILETYEQFAKFPFSGYGACVTPLYGGGALEAYSFATYGYYPGEDSHEPAHTWWGGMINNTYLNSLWNESFADWCGGFYGRNAPLGNKEERQTAFIQTPDVSPAYNAAPLNDSPPDIGPASTTLGYGKGAYVLQMLEHEIGPDKMLEACRQWIKTQDKTRGGEWEDFEAVVQKVAGRDLKWFFNEWVRTPGYPEFVDMKGTWADGKVTLKAEMKNGPWKITADVLLRYKDGRQVIVRSTNDWSGPVWEVPSAEKPVLVSFDPWRRIIRKFDRSEEPTSIASTVGNMGRYTDPAHQDWLKNLGGHALTVQPGNLDNTFLVGSPKTLPAMKALCDKVGFSVVGNELTYKGTKIDLNKGGAVAVVDLANGKKCAIGLGRIRNMPNFGRTRLMVFDELGRFLRGVTDPKTAGFLTFRL